MNREVIFTEVIIGERAAIDNERTSGIQNTCNPRTMARTLIVRFFSGNTFGAVRSALNGNRAAAIDRNCH